MRKIYLAIGALAVLGLLAIAGCGGGGSTTSNAASGSGGEAETTANSTGGETGGYGGGAYGGGGYGGESESSESSTEMEGEGAESTPAATTVAVVKVMNTPKLGRVIVDSKGMTLYDFRKDKGTTSACYGECAVAWPPLLTKSEPKAAEGAEQSLLGTTKRKDGTVQVTYAGHPVYGFVEDKKPGETNGNEFTGFGAPWYALMPNGEKPAGG